VTAGTRVQDDFDRCAAAGTEELSKRLEHAREDSGGSDESYRSARREAGEGEAEREKKNDRRRFAPR